MELKGMAWLQGPTWPPGGAVAIVVGEIFERQSVGSYEFFIISFLVSDFLKRFRLRKYEPFSNILKASGSSVQ